MDAPSGRAVVSATWRPFTFLAELEPGDGWSVGNRFPALPPGLSVGLKVVVTPGRLPTGSGDVVVIGVDVWVDDDVGLGDEDAVGLAVPEIWTVEDADGSADRLVALPITVNLTDVTDVAVAATSDSAWSCRSADCASISPRSQDAVPSSVPQPKLNFGPALDGVACRRMVASGRLPPVVQALTTHWVIAPRSLVDAELVISTQRSTVGSL